MAVNDAVVVIALVVRRLRISFANTIPSITHGCCLNASKFALVRGQQPGRDQLHPGGCRKERRL